MAKRSVKKKESYGGCRVNHFSPAAGEGWPKAINIILGFEEALKLQLALQVRLMDISRLNRSTKGRRPPPHGAGKELVVAGDYGGIVEKLYGPRGAQPIWKY